MLLEFPPTLPAPPPFPPDQRAEAAEQRRMERELVAATREGRLALHYQPRLMLEGGRPLGAEALVRWPHRTRGMLPRAMLRPAAQRSGQVVEIGAWALATACAQAAGWPGASIVALNLGAEHLACPGLLAQVAAALQGAGLPAERLELGLSEATLLDLDDDVYLALAALRDLGVQVSMDDFGASLGSLTLLRRLPLTVLRLDRALIRDVPADPGAIAVARAAIQAAHALGLGVGAIGIESEPQRAVLADCGCDQGQGPLFGTPLDAARIGPRLAD